MKFVIKPSSKKRLGYCFGCGEQCQNDCGKQCASKR